MSGYEDVFDVIKKSGVIEDKTFLVFFGSWKHKATGEKVRWFYKYLDNCSMEDAIAWFQAGDFERLATKGGGQTHLHLMARYVDSGALVAIQLHYTGPPDYGMNPAPGVVLEGERAKQVRELLRTWKGE